MRERTMTGTAKPGLIGPNRGELAGPVQEDYAVVILDGDHRESWEVTRELLAAANCGTVLCRASDEDEIIEAARDADGIIVTGGITARLMASLTRCRVIARNGIGMDTVEATDVATAKGIVLCNMPGIIEEEVADQTMALLLAVARVIVPLDRYVREGDWSRGAAVPAPFIPRLAGGVLGLVGLGRIGQAVARRAAGFGLRLLAYDPFVAQETFVAYRASQGTFAQVLEDSDFVSLHVPLAPHTEHLVGAPELRLMRPHAILINTSRGRVIDEGALIMALQTGRIAGAGLDVMEHEPITEDHPFCRLPNVVLAPHWASHSEWTDRQRQIRPAQEVAAVLAGHRPRAVCNPEVLEHLDLR